MENTVERALILSRNKPLRFDDLPLVTGTDVRTEHSSPPEEESLNLDNAVRQHIQKVLNMTDGTVGGDKGAAKLLEMNQSTLRHRMRKLGIPFGRESNT